MKWATIEQIRSVGAQLDHGEPGTECKRCGHPFDPHRAVALDDDPRAGGAVMCQVKGCRCYASFSIPQLGSTQETVRVPDFAEFEQLMIDLQTEDA